MSSPVRAECRSVSPAVASLIRASVDQQRRLGDIAMRHDELYARAVEKLREANNAGGISVTTSTNNAGGISVTTSTLIKFALPWILRRPVVIYRGGEPSEDDYKLPPRHGCDASDVHRINDDSLHCEAVLLHEDRAGIFRSVVPDVELADVRVSLELRRGAECIRDDSQRDHPLMTTFMAALHNQMCRLGLEDRLPTDASGWANLAAKADPTSAVAELSCARWWENSHGPDRQTAAAAITYLVKHVIPDAFGVYVAIYNKYKPGSVPNDLYPPKTARASGAILLFYDDRNRDNIPYQSMIPLRATSRTNAGYGTDGYDRVAMDAKAATRRDPSGKQRRRKCSHDALARADDLIGRTKTEKLYSNIREFDKWNAKATIICEVCDEECFPDEFQSEPVPLSAQQRRLWIDCARLVAEESTVNDANLHHTRGNVGVPDFVRACSTCSREMLKNNRSAWPWTWKNLAPLVDVPLVLRELNDLEFQMISLVVHNLRVYISIDTNSKKGGEGTYIPETEGLYPGQQTVSKNNVFLYHNRPDEWMEDVSSVRLPRRPGACGMVFVIRPEGHRHASILPIRVEMMLDAFEVLLSCDPAYKNVDVDHELIAELRARYEQSTDSPDHAFADEITVVEDEAIVNSAEMQNQDEGTGASARASATFVETGQLTCKLFASVRERLCVSRRPAMIPSAENQSTNAVGAATEGNVTVSRYPLPNKADDNIWRSRCADDMTEAGEENITKAFPRLFFRGGKAIGVIRARLKALNLSCTITLDGYIRHLMRVYDRGGRRFQRNHELSFFFFNARQRHRLLSVSARVSQGIDGADTTIRAHEARELGNSLGSLIAGARANAHDDGPEARATRKTLGRELLNRISYQCVPARGTALYNQEARRDLLAMINSKACGSPTFFLTLSPADTYWPELFLAIVPTANLDVLTQADRKRLLKDNPVLAARFFERRLRLFIKHMLHGDGQVLGGPVSDLWYRIEFQHRGSPHAHMLVWIDREPRVNELMNDGRLDELYAFADSVLLAVQPGKHPDYTLTGRKRSAGSTRYDADDVDPFDDYGEHFTVPAFSTILNMYGEGHEQHPACRRVDVDSWTQCVESRNADHYALCAALQTHKCISRFCGHPCKRRYPRDRCEKTFLKRTQDGSKRMRLSIEPARNSRFVVPHNRYCLLAWRGNMDLQIITDASGSASYVTGISMYCTKPDQADATRTEQEIDNALKRTLRNGHENETKALFRRVGYAALKHQPVAAQHAAWFNLRHDFVYSTRRVITVRIPIPAALCTNEMRTVPIHAPEVLEKLDDEAEAADLNEGDRPAITKLMEDYSNREEGSACQLTLREFAAWYDADSRAVGRLERISCGKLNFRKREHEKVVRVAPHVKFNIDDEKCAYLLCVLDTPWRSLGDLLPANETSYVAALRSRRHLMPADVAAEYFSTRVTDSNGEHVPGAVDARDLVDPFVSSDEGNTHNHTCESEIDPEDQFLDAYLAEFEDIDDGMEDPNLENYSSNEGDMESATTSATLSDNVRVVSQESMTIRRDFLREALAVLESRRNTLNASLIERNERVMGAMRARVAQRVSRFKGGQLNAYHHIVAALRDPAAEQVRAAIVGEAGTGKSELLHAIRDSARVCAGNINAAVIMAFTGLASFLVGGLTIHKTLHIGIGSKSEKNSIQLDEKGKTLASLRIAFRDVQIVLVDEKSLIHLEMLHWMDERLKQAKGNDKRFGGVHIVFFGDFFQLPPVSKGKGQKPLYEPCEKEGNAKPEFVQALRGREAWLSLNTYFELDHNYRQQGADRGFIESLRKARQGEAPTNLEVLKTRERSTDQAFKQSGANALWVAATNDICEEINQLELAKRQQCGFPPVHVWAKHGRVSGADPKRGTDGGCSKLRKEELQACYKHVPSGKEKLQPMLRLSPGARVMITRNDNERMALGLVNGAMGTLIGFEYNSPVLSQPNPGMSYKDVTNSERVHQVPIALVKLDCFAHDAGEYPGGDGCEMPKLENTPGVADLGIEANSANVVPIFPMDEVVAVNVAGKVIKYMRTQLPLTVARATTIHKAQGRTVDELVYVPSQPYAFGLIYVALSRCRTLAGIIIVKNFRGKKGAIYNLCENIFKFRSDTVKKIIAEYARLKQMFMTR